VVLLVVALLVVALRMLTVEMMLVISVARDDGLSRGGARRGGGW
jgi:hypothetical protein